MKPRTLVPVIVAALLVCGIALVVWQRRHSVPPLAVTLVGYRTASDERVAVFRATNFSEQPFAFYGGSVSDPLFWYRVPDGSSWKSMARTGGPKASGFYTLERHSNIEFTMAPPSPLNSKPARLPDGGRAASPSGSGSFAITLFFIPGDAPSVHKAVTTNSYTMRESVVIALLEPVRWASSAGFIRQADYAKVASKLVSRWIWVSSDSATP